MSGACRDCDVGVDSWLEPHADICFDPLCVDKGMSAACRDFDVGVDSRLESHVVAQRFSDTVRDCDVEVDRQPDPPECVEGLSDAFRHCKEPLGVAKRLSDVFRRCEFGVDSELEPHRVPDCEFGVDSPPEPLGVDKRLSDAIRLCEVGVNSQPEPHDIAVRLSDVFRDCVVMDGLFPLDSDHNFCGIESESSISKSAAVEEKVEWKDMSEGKRVFCVPKLQTFCARGEFTPAQHASGKLTSGIGGGSRSSPLEVRGGGVPAQQAVVKFPSRLGEDWKCGGVTSSPVDAGSPVPLSNHNSSVTHVQMDSSADCVRVRDISDTKSSSVHCAGTFLRPLRHGRTVLPANSVRGLSSPNCSSVHCVGTCAVLLLRRVRHSRM